MQSGKRVGGRRREVLNTTETRSQRWGKGRWWGWGWGPDHSFTFLLHFYFRHWKRKQKKGAKREIKVITSQLAGTKRRISWRI